MILMHEERDVRDRNFYQVRWAKTEKHLLLLLPFPENPGAHFGLQFGCNSLATNTYSVGKLLNFLLISLKEVSQLGNEKWRSIWKGN